MNRNSWILSDWTGSCLYLYPDSFISPSSSAIVGAGTGAVSDTADWDTTPAVGRTSHGWDGSKDDPVVQGGPRNIMDR